MKHLSVLDMKQQYIFKLILIRGITLFSTGISSHIPCFIDGLLLYVAYLSSDFGNSKMVTECEPKPISMNFGSPRRGESPGGSCVEGMVQDWIGQKKKTILATIYPTYFCCNKDFSEAMLPIYYGTSFLTFCQISGLKEAFENIIKYQLT